MATASRRQQGLSMIGFLFVAIVLAAIAMIGFRMVPSYIEYFTIQKAIEKSMRDVPDPTPVAVKRAFDKYIAADYIDSVVASDLDVRREGNKMVASIEWQKRLHMVGNVSLLLDFDASSTR